MTNNKFKLDKPKIIHDPSISLSPGLAVAILPNGKHALTSGLDFQLRLWDLKAGSCTKTWDARGPLFSITVNTSGNLALLGAVQGIVSWDIESWILNQPNTLWSFQTINTVAYAESSGEVLGGSEDTTIHRWNINSQKKLSRLIGHKITVTTIALDKVGRVAISGDLYGQLRLWNLENGICLHDWRGHEGNVCSVDMSSDGRLVLSAGEDGKIILWDLQKLEAIHTLKDRNVRDVILNCDASLVISCGDDGISHWNLREEELIAKYMGKDIKAISMSPDESILMALQKNNLIFVWENNLI